MYTATINMPGYLPEIEPVEFEHLWEAWAYIANEIETDWNNVDAPDFVAFHKANKAWGVCYDAAMTATEPGTIEAPNGLSFNVDRAA